MSIRYAAMGDSVTLGMGDRVPDSGWRGWTALLAPCLDPGNHVSFRNFADSGARVADVHAVQLPQVLAWQPQLTSVLIGTNDTLRGTFDLRTIAVRFDGIVAALAASKSRVLTACLPEPGHMIRLPGLMARPLARRIRSLNEVIHAISTRYDAFHIHLHRNSELTNRLMWSIDRLHPSERGHRWLAAQAFDALRTAGFPVGNPPDLRPTSIPPTRAAQIAWMSTKGAKWVCRRSIDLLPTMLRLAAQEWRRNWQESSGLADGIQDVDVALASLPSRSIPG